MKTPREGSVKRAVYDVCLRYPDCVSGDIIMKELAGKDIVTRRPYVMTIIDEMLHCGFLIRTSYGGPGCGDPARFRLGGPPEDEVVRALLDIVNRGTSDPNRSQISVSQHGSRWNGWRVDVVYRDYLWYTCYKGTWLPKGHASLLTAVRSIKRQLRDIGHIDTLDCAGSNRDGEVHNLRLCH